MDTGVLETLDSIEDLRKYAIDIKMRLDFALQEAAEYRSKYELEQAKHEQLRHMVYGRRSEKVKEEDSSQGQLFNEAETENQKEVGSTDEQIKIVKPKVKTPGSGRRRPPAHAEHVDVVHDLSVEEKTCPCCGKERPSIGDEQSEEIAVIPAKVVVRTHIRKKYGPCPCAQAEQSGQKAIVTAPGPVKIAPGSLFANETIAFIIISKFVDGLPFYRQEPMMERYGLEIGRGTMARLVVRVSGKLGLFVERMQTHIRGSPVIRMDETTVQVLKEPDRSPSATSRMWVSMGYREGRPIVMFTYSPSRSGEVAKAILGDYSGYLQTDGYSGYTAIGKREGVAHVGCWAHIRRGFFDVHRSQKSPLALEAVSLIKKLYRIERRLRKELETNMITEIEFVQQRQKETAPVFAEILQWLIDRKAELPPQGALGSAVSYALGQYERAIRYVEHVLLTPDNNPAENAIRPFVIGRKNWLFSDTQAGAWASATLYSLVETAKANGHEPYRYLCHLFDRLPLAHTPEEIDALLPYVLRPDAY